MAKPPQTKGPELRARGYPANQITWFQTADFWISSIRAVLLLARIALPRRIVGDAFANSPRKCAA
jgi:hypothetical protein